MPIYEYKCPECGWSDELLQKVEDLEKPLPHCDKCFTKLERVLGTPAFDLRGEGWYDGGVT